MLIRLMEAKQMAHFLMVVVPKLDIEVVALQFLGLVEAQLQFAYHLAHLMPELLWLEEEEVLVEIAIAVLMEDMVVDQMEETVYMVHLKTKELVH